MIVKYGIIVVTQEAVSVTSFHFGDATNARREALQWAQQRIETELAALDMVETSTFGTVPAEPEQTEPKRRKSKLLIN